MLPKLKCAADAPDFLQRMMDRTRERIRAASAIRGDR